MNMQLMMARARMNHSSGGGAFTPANLFSSGERGAWYDPSDLSTMFQDTAGTTPVTAAGQKIARINDKSGNGHHATQATSGKQPYLRNDGANYYLEMVAANSTYLHAAKDTLLSMQSDSPWVLCGLRLDSTSCTAIGASGNDASIPGYSMYFSSGAPTLYMTGNYSPKAYFTGPTLGTSLNYVTSGYWNRAIGEGETRVNKVGRSGGPVSFADNPAINRSQNIGMTIGADPTNTAETTFGSFFYGRIYGAIIRYSTINMTIMADAETWLGEKCGLTI